MIFRSRSSGSASDFGTAGRGRALGRARGLENADAEADDRLSLGGCRERQGQAQPEHQGEHRSEECLEPLAGIMQPGHHGPDRAVEHLGDLAVRQAFDVTEHDNRSGLGRQGIERAPDALPLLLPRRLLLGPPARIRRRPRPFLLAHPLRPERARLGAPLAVPVGGDVDGDAKEPGVERRLPAERRQRMKRPYECLLRHVPRLLAVVQDLVGQAPHPLTVLLDERLERGRVSGDASLDERRARRSRGAPGPPRHRPRRTACRGRVTAESGAGPRAPYSTAGWTSGSARRIHRRGREAARRPEGPRRRAQQGIHPEQVAGGPEAGDLADRGRGDHRVVAELLPRVDVREVDLDDGDAHRGDRVAQRDRVVRQRAGVEDDALESLATRRTGSSPPARPRDWTAGTPPARRDSRRGAAPPGSPPRATRGHTRPARGCRGGSGWGRGGRGWPMRRGVPLVGENTPRRRRRQIPGSAPV